MIAYQRVRETEITGVALERLADQVVRELRRHLRIAPVERCPCCERPMPKKKGKSKTYQGKNS